MSDIKLNTEGARHRMASDPALHAWVSASAGTGKTTALTHRILRLLLDGNAPDSLLAITFTRTAAAEMRARIARTLAAWVRMDDSRLTDTLAQMGVERPYERLGQARALFAHVLDAPGGLNIQTIHSFAQSLLAAFPLESGLAPGVEPLDDRSAELLLKEAFRLVLDEAARAQGAALARDIGQLAVESHEGDITDRMKDFARAADAMAELGPASGIAARLRRWLGLPSDRDRDDLVRAAIAPGAAIDSAIAGFADAMERYGTEDKRKPAIGARLWLELDETRRMEQWQDARSLVLDGKDKPRSFKTVSKRVPDILDLAQQLLAAVNAVDDIDRAFAFIDHVGAWLRVGQVMAFHYQALKTANAAIDYDDMIRLAVRLLGEDGMVNWVTAKLDRRISHILVDEAQDTNPAQWQIVNALAAEFLAGEGQHNQRRRTLFVVGDFKQAIFSFQGTDPQIFASEQRRLTAQLASGSNPLETIALDRNFRSGPAVLRLVDALIEQQGPAAFGLGDTAVPPHIPQRLDAPGMVMLLPPWESGQGAADSGDDPDEPSVGDGADDGPVDPGYAMALARLIEGWVRPGSPERLWLPGAGGREARWAEAGDVLVLVRARGSIMAQLVAALHACRINVAGVDRMLLSAPLAVQDLLSVIRFVLQPADDLALAEMLTSPLVGADHEAVRLLREPGRTLWDSLRQSADTRWHQPQAQLRDLLGRADQSTPHNFLHGLLADGARARFYARMGREVEDGIDMLLAQALIFEQRHAPTLQGFLRWIEQAVTEVKRDPEGAGDRVRIMTVHGSKGLQAPIVLLADALRGRRSGDRFVKGCPETREEVPLPFGKGSRRPAKVSALWTAADVAAEQEWMRLLYVALTRAEDVLAVAGEAPTKKTDKPRWHGMVESALNELGAVAEEVGIAPWSSPALVLRHGSLRPPETVPANPQPGADRSLHPRQMPLWAHAPLPPEPAGARPWTPSAPVADEAPLPPPTPAMRAAAARGTLLHRLFERLPEVPTASRRAIAIRVGLAAGFPEPEAAKIADTAIAVMDDAAFAPLFGPQSLAEAPVAGTVRGLSIAGVVDRLLVEPQRVLVVDFKTGHAVPDDASAVHPNYLRQMAAYALVLGAAFPGRRIEAALLFTAAPKLILIPPKLLQAHQPGHAA